jgi:glycogen debranching enzyme
VQAYIPLDYQVGAVWPHDNALIALGMRRCGLPDAMEQVFTGIFAAARNFSHYRLPEVFDGFAQRDYSLPVHYPIACKPQAWAAGALPLLLTAAMGLEPDAPHGVLRISRPHLPAWLGDATIRGLRVGAARVDLRYRRTGATTLDGVLTREGDVSVMIEY